MARTRTERSGVRGIATLRPLPWGHLLHPVPGSSSRQAPKSLSTISRCVLSSGTDPVDFAFPRGLSRSQVDIRFPALAGRVSSILSHAVDAEMEAIVECLKEACEPQEIVFLNDLPERAALGLECTTRTLSGQNLKARWVEVDGLAYRLDWLNPEKPRFFLDQREQHALVGSLCEGRTVLDGYAHSGAFALQAARAGAEHVVAVDSSLPCIKAIGAQAQKNNCFVETIQADISAFLNERKIGELDAIILDPPQSEAFDTANVEALHTSA